MGKIEKMKAVSATLGGAYATLQNASLAKHFATKTLAIARISGEAALEIRARIYVVIAEVLSLKSRNTSDKKTAKIKRSFFELLEESSKFNDDSLAGLIKYGLFMLNIRLNMLQDGLAVNEK